MADKTGLTEEQIDFLKEAVNIGAGNAATALSQMLGCSVEVNIPNVYSLAPKRLPSILTSPSLPVVCVKMGLIGDIKGEMFFVVPEKNETELARLVEKHFLGSSGSGSLDKSVLEEVGNILAGVYLTSIHDFCKLNIYHTVPMQATDMFQALLDELLAVRSANVESFIAVEHEFVVIESNIKADSRHIRAILLMVPNAESIGRLVSSMNDAMPQ